MHPFRISIAISVALLTSALQAQEAPRDLGTVEVIGNREPAALPFTTDTIDATEIAASHRNELSQVLEAIPGVALQNLGQRRERLLSLRGFSSRQVPLFIDGVPVYVPYDGNVDLSRFGVDYVSEVSVSKGLSSLLYGPNILGGAINVISRRPVEPLEASARLAGEFDSHGSGIQQRGAVNLGTRSDLWYLSLSASAVDADGYRLPSSFRPVAAENGGDRENASSRDSLYVVRAGFTPSEDHEYGVTYYRQDGKKNDPPYAGSYLRTNARLDGVQVRFWNWPWWDKESVALVSRDALGTNGTLRLRAYYDKFQNSLESYDDANYTTQTRPYAFAGSRYYDYSVGGGADYEWRWSEAHVTRLSGHYKRDVHREQQRAPAVPQQRLDIPTYDYAVEHEWLVTPSFSLTPSYQHVVQSGRTVQVYGGGRFSPVTVNESTADNGQLVATWKLDEAGALVGGVSRKTRFPTLKERFSGGLGSAVPNPALEPEYATHYELGYSYKGSNWDGKVSLYNSELRDAIEGVTLPGTACSSPPCTQQRNVGRQRNRGVELSGEYQPVDSLRLAGQIDLLQRKNLSSPNIIPTNTPRRRYRAVADWQIAPEWKLRVDGQYESERASNTNGTRIAGGFALVNAFARWAPDAHWGFELGGRNLGDRLYAYEEGFYEAGRTFLLQVDWRY
ncbi:MAG: TonB-dependent receptor [Steroidobacteraceae bacterium]